MEPVLLLLGIFVIAATLSNKEVRKKGRSWEDNFLLDYQFLNALVLILGGLAFLMPAARSQKTFSLLVPSFVILAAAQWKARGPILPIARIGVLAIVVYTIMGSFM